MRICIGANDMADITNFIQKKVNDNKKNFARRKKIIYLVFISNQDIHQTSSGNDQIERIFSQSHIKF